MLDFYGVASSISRTIKTSNWPTKLRSKDPLAEFRREAFQTFETLLFKVNLSTLKLLMNLKVVVQEEEKKSENTPVAKKQKISRNAPCTCGSGKKYKHCHGKVA